jgi:hypothetical protein
MLASKKSLSNFLGMQILQIMLVLHMVTAQQSDLINQQYVLLTCLCYIKLISVSGNVRGESAGVMFMHSIYIYIYIYIYTWV